MAPLGREHILFPSPVRTGTDVHRIMPIFASEPDLYCLPVVDHDNVPLGIISEKDLKQFAYSFYGRELIRKKALADFIMPCPAVEIDSEEEELLALAGTSGSYTGVVVTLNGAYLGFIDNRGLLAIYEKNRLEKQQELLHAQRLESLGTLAGGIAHELNNLLVPIVGYTDILLGLSADGDRSKQHLQNVMSAAEKAKELVNQMLSFSRKGPQRFSCLALSDLVREVNGLMKVSVSSEIEIRTLFDAYPDFIEGDPTQLHQVLVNLCANAAKAIEPGSGTIEVSLDRIPLSASESAAPDLPSGDYVRITVKDTGCGIPPDIISRIFEPFFTTRRNAKGTGLGLSVVHGIVKAHGGVVTVESIVGKGSIFRVYLPSCVGPQPSAAVPDGVPVCGNAKILVVDDNEDVTNVWSLMLTEVGYTVTTFNNSMKALQTFQKAPDAYDLVITDQIMPNLCGSDLASEILKIHRELPIILCTGFSEAIEEDQARNLGIKKYLLKPLKSNQLVTAVQELLQEARQ